MEMERRIHQAFSKITPEMLKLAVEAYKMRLEEVIKSDGMHVSFHKNHQVCVDQICQVCGIPLNYPCHPPECV